MLGGPSIETGIDEMQCFQERDNPDSKLSSREYSIGDCERTCSTTESTYNCLLGSLDLPVLHNIDDNSDKSLIDAKIEESEQKKETPVKILCPEPLTSKYFLPTPPICDAQIATQPPHRTAQPDTHTPVLSHRQNDQGLVHTQQLIKPLVYVQELETNCTGITDTEALDEDQNSDGHTYDTTNLLTQFMEMRGVKGNQAAASDPKRVPSLCPTQSPNGPKLRQGHQEQTDISSTTASDRQQIAIAPEASTPEAAGYCMVSLQLGHTMIRLLEEFWPAERLIDRDYNSHLCVSDCQPFGTGAMSLASQSFEVDISLTPSDGIVVTSLLQVKQKPLPGSKALTSIRQRIMNLSQRYRTLTVFVSEANVNGEHMAEMPSSDLVAYSDFVGFTLSLPNETCVYLVPGADKTLERWIQPVMARYAQQMDSLNETMSFCNTSWELFFRQSGMNALVSQVLSHALFKELGTSGLVTFLGMTPEQQRLKYGTVLGLEDAIANAGLIWNKTVE